MNIRNAINVPGVPYTWTTNLSDEEIYDFQAIYSEKIKEPNEGLEVKGATFVLKFRLDFLPFREGFCVWSATGENQTVLYRTKQDWELWNARQAEIEELRQEQAAEEAIEKQLVMTEDGYLRAKTDTAKEIGDYESAAHYITARAELRERFQQFRGMPVDWMHWYPDLVFSDFPESKYGITFLRRFHRLPQCYTNFAHWFSVRCGASGEALVQQTWNIYEEGMKLFPKNGRMPQAASLFLRRVGRYDLAIGVCVAAINRGLRDGTKSGFEGRIKRLEKESGKKHKPVAMDPNLGTTRASPYPDPHH